MSAFAQLKALQATLEGFLPGSQGERIFWQDIAEEAAALAKFAQQQAKREDRERAARGVHRLKGKA